MRGSKPTFPYMLSCRNVQLNTAIILHLCTCTFLQVLYYHVAFSELKLVSDATGAPTSEVRTSHISLLQIARHWCVWHFSVVQWRIKIRKIRRNGSDLKPGDKHTHGDTR